MTDGSLTIVAKPNPMQGDSFYCIASPGQTVAQLMGESAAYSMEVTIGGYPVPRELWGKVRPKAGQTLHVVVYPQGGNAGKWVKLVAVLVISYFTLGAGSAAAAAWLGVSTTTLGVIGLVAIMAVNALIPPPVPKGFGGSGDPFQTLNSLTGTSNQASPYSVIPCVVGTRRFFPPHAALPYTEISGSDQYLRMLLDLGYGDLDISDIRIGETDIASYEDVQIEIGTNPSIFSQDIYEAAVGTTLENSGDTATRATQTLTTEVSLDIIFPGGLFGVDAKGNTITAYTSFTVEYRATGTGGAWLQAQDATGLTMTGGLTIDAGIIKLNSSAKKTLRCGIRWLTDSGQYDVRVTRGASSWPGATPGGGVGTATWSVLRSISPQLPSTTDTLKMAVRIKATDQLNGVVQNLSVLASQKIPTWDVPTQTWTANAPSTNPAWIDVWLMTRCPAVIRRVSDDRMDLDGIADWAGECAAKGYSVSFVMDSGRAFGDILRDVLAAGRASFGMHNGKYSAVRDLEQTVPVQMFTPKNSWGFNYSRSFVDLPHALRVKFTNPEASNQQDYRVVYWDGYNADGSGGLTAATRFEELDLSMVIDPDAAWRLGRYHLSVMYCRPTQYTFNADIEHMVCERGDLIQVAHDIIGYGIASGRVKSVSAGRVTLDEPLVPEAGKSYAIRVRRSLDDVQGEVSAEALVTWDSTLITFDSGMSFDDTGPSYTFTVPDGFAIYPGDLYVLGEVSQITAKLVVRAVEPSQDLTATITAVDYSDTIINADSGTPPAFVSEITGTGWCAAPDVPSVTVRIGDSSPDDAGIIRTASAVSADLLGGIYRLPSYKQSQLGLLGNT